MATTAIDQSRPEAFMGQAVVDLAASFNAPLVRLGARLGLYRALADGGPATPDELAERTGTEPRMVREWLGNQAAGGWVMYDAESVGPGRLHGQGTARPGWWAVACCLLLRRLGRSYAPATSSVVPEPGRGKPPRS